MKKSIVTLASIAITALLLGVQATHAYTTSNDSPWANFTSGSDHPLIFSETVINSYAGETDKTYGKNQFSFQLNGYDLVSQLVCNPTCFTYIWDYSYQSFLQFETNTFVFTPQIWSALEPGNPSEVWAGSTVPSGLNVPTSQLANYEIFEAINVESSSRSVTVTGCSINITIPGASIYAGVMKVSTCQVLWSNAQSFPTKYEQTGGFERMQTGLLGLGNGSSANFTRTVAHYTLFEYDCASNGCTYSFSPNSGTFIYDQETSNLSYIANPNSGGYHVNECSESPNESVC